MLTCKKIKPDGTEIVLYSRPEFKKSNQRNWDFDFMLPEEKHKLCKYGEVRFRDKEGCTIVFTLEEPAVKVPPKPKLIIPGR